MSGDFQNEQKFIYVFPTHPLFRQKNPIVFAKYSTSFVLVSVHVR